MNFSDFDLDDADPASLLHPSPVPALAPFADSRETLRHVLEQLTAAFRSDAGGPLDTTLAFLALQLTRWVATPFPLRATLVGPTGSGKTHLLQLIARITRAPSAIVPVTDIAETSWTGTQIGDVCRALHPSLFLHPDSSGRPTVPRRPVDLPSIVLLDEMDKLALNPIEGVRLDAAAAAWRIGRQQSVLPMLDPLSTMMIRADDARASFQWTLKKSIVISSGAWGMLKPQEAVTASALARVGFLPELIDRMGPILTMPSPSMQTLTARNQCAVQDALAMAADLGVTVHGVAAFLATLSAPGGNAPYLGPRGMQHFAEQQVLACVAAALAAGVSETTMPRHRASDAS